MYELHSSRHSPVQSKIVYILPCFSQNQKYIILMTNHKKLLLTEVFGIFLLHPQPRHQRFLLQRKPRQSKNP